MARNRKRAKERRARRPQGASLTAPPAEREATPDPIEHAAPDVELAEAQLALGRAERPDDARADLIAEDEDEDEALDLDGVEAVEAETAQDASAPVQSDAVSDGTPKGRDVAARGSHAVEPHATAGNRLINFLQGSWRELQRVQWPDRRQVMQATSVVIGFVIVAGVFLGVADFLAAKLMNYILK